MSMKKAFSLILTIALLLSLCAPALAAENDRPGAAWINSDIYGTFDGMGEIRPQDDFAAAINREWAESAQIPAGQGLTSARVELEMENNAMKLALLSGEKKDDPELTSMQNFYAQLLDWDARNAIGYQELKTYAQDIMSISSIDELTAYLSDPDRNIYMYGTPMIQGMVKADDEDALTNIMNIGNPALLSSDDPSFYTDEEDGMMRSIFRRLLVYMLTRLDYSEAEAAELFERCLAFESHFVPAIDEFVARLMREGDSAARMNPLTIEELDAAYKNIPIRQIYTSLGYDLGDKVNEWMPAALRMYDSLYTEENLEDMKAWILVQSILPFQDYMDRETYEVGARLGNEMSGADSLVPDEQYAVNAIYERIPGMIDKLFAEYCFDPEIKVQMTELTKQMIAAYRVMLTEEVDWLTDETRAAAIEKLDNIKLHVCYPDELPDFSDVSIPSVEEGGTVVKTIVTIMAHDRKANAELLQRKNDGTAWNHTTQYSQLGASYMPNENSININAGLCGGDFYDASWPIERRLGGVCMVVGHEISHAFDTRGADYDKDGNYRDWWKPEDRQAFNDRVNRLVAYYSQIVPVPQLSDKPYGEDGARFIMGEAIADLASVKCLLSIARGIENFDYELFFTQLARIQKVARYDAAEMFYLNTDNHPVDCFRCNVPLSNYDEFLETYGVKEGDGMYLAPEDRIRVW